MGMSLYMITNTFIVIWEGIVWWDLLFMFIGTILMFKVVNETIIQLDNFTGIQDILQDHLVISIFVFFFLLLFTLTFRFWWWMMYIDVLHRYNHRGILHRGMQK